MRRMGHGGWVCRPCAGWWAGSRRCCSLFGWRVRCPAASRSAYALLVMRQIIANGDQPWPATPAAIPAATPAASESARAPRPTSQASFKLQSPNLLCSSQCVYAVWSSYECKPKSCPGASICVYQSRLHVVAARARERREKEIVGSAGGLLMYILLQTRNSCLDPCRAPRCRRRPRWARCSPLSSATAPTSPS